jgi:putative flavoprotein involved in K+ transport
MRHTDVIVIGAGQAGLAMSHCLSARGIAHVVLERGRVAERWHSERWNSLRLLTPNWMSRLPGRSYRGADPEGFMAVPEVIALFEDYARCSKVPVETESTVRALRHAAGGYRVETDRGSWSATAVVIATGHCDMPHVPSFTAELPASVHQVTPSGYRDPGLLPDGGVLVVGASATGVQLAEEIQRSGRPVTLAVGRHTRLPRRYRGQDIMMWMARAGVLSEPAEQVDDLARARAQPSLQLIGSPEHRNLDLGVLRASGVRIVGRVFGATAGRVLLRDDLAETAGKAQRRLERLLARIDPVADAAGAAEERWPAPLAPFAAAPAVLDLVREGIRSVVWATGFRRDYSWLQLPVLDSAGEILHHRGITSAPGLYVLGLRFLRRRDSSFIGGVGADAVALTERISLQFASRRRIAA